MQAVERGYAVIAVSSFDRDTKCWHNTAASRSEDLQVRRLPRSARMGPCACSLLACPALLARRVGLSPACWHLR